MKHKTPLFSRCRFILFSRSQQNTFSPSTLFNFLSRNKSSHIKQPKKITFLSLFSLFHSSLPLSLFSHPSENILYLLHILSRVLLAERIKHASTTSRTSTTTNNNQHTKFLRHHLKSTENLRRSSICAKFHLIRLTFSVHNLTCFFLGSIHRAHKKQHGVV